MTQPRGAADFKELLFRMVAEKEIGAEQALRLVERMRDADPGFRLDRTAQPTASAAAKAADIAVIGMAGRFGSCADLDAYWQMLAEGRDCIIPFPEHRTARVGQPAPPDAGGFLPDEDAFDPLFFKISPPEAAVMDPQQRIFLEAAYHALEDAGYGEAELSNSRCGVFVGAGAGDYVHLLAGTEADANPLALMGNVASILAARIAYFLNLKGPSVALDTACSSSLVAIHLACESLQAGTCDMALAGGVCVINTPRFISSMRQAGMLSPSFRCHTFDAAADGFVCGEGAGVVVLKRLDRALAEGDHICGVIKGSGINQDGRTNGITAPSSPSQTALETEVYRRAGIDPASLGYVEAHGTGTPLGDPIEIEALTRAFVEFTDRRSFCAIGSVKTNIGHALTAAGVAGLLKVLLAFRYGALPPSLNFERANAEIDFAATPFFVNTALRPWPAEPGRPRRAAISSFGFSGTNAHLVIEEPSPTPPRPKPAREAHLFVLSARSPEALRARCDALAARLSQASDLGPGDIAYTLAVGRSHFAHRLAIVAEHLEGVRAKLAAVAASETPAGVFVGHVAGAEKTAGPALAEVLDRALADVRDKGDSKASLILADFYVGGTAFDWREAYPANLFRRESLPGYPFEPVHCPPRVTAPAPVSDLRTPIRAALEAAKTAETAALETGGRGFAELEAWGRRALVAAMSEFGLFDPAKPVATRAGLRKRLAISPERARLFAALLDILARENAIAIEGDLVRRDPAAVLPEAAGLAAARQATEAAYPELAPFFDLLARCVTALPELLTGRRPAAEILFPDGRMTLVERIYHGNALADYYNRLIAAAVSAAAERIAAEPARICRVIEIGAGTGGATGGIVAALAPLKDRLSYRYTDLSRGFLQLGKSRFAKQYPFLEFGLLDIERDPAEQGVGPGTFDIAIASNVLHATRRIDATLANAKQLLAPGGVLILNEVTAVQDFATLTFGLTDGWWAFEDAPQRLRGAPLLDVGRWRAALASAGFGAADAAALPGQADEASFAQSVLVAYRDAAYRDAPRPAAVTVQTETAAIEIAPAAAKTAEQCDIESLLRAEVAAVLTLPESAIDPAGRFMDYGIDSILGVELVSRLNTRLGLDLRPTIVFDAPTVADLARRLERDHGAALAARPEPAAPPATTASPAVPAIVAADKPDRRIAVIGMAGRFATARDLAEFRRMLADGRSGITEGGGHWNADPASLPDAVRSEERFLRWGGTLADIERFDPLFFRISGKEAELTDPQHRVFLTEAWKALEDAAYGDEALDGARCGVFVGAHGGDYTHRMLQEGVVPNAFAFMGNAASILAARIAYILNLKGPCLAVDTACSSSLVAVHLACQSILAGECDMALAGGVFINTTMGFNTAAAKAGMLSPDGRCKTFDASADGFVPGEGAGVVVLKPYARALADGDHIEAVILGSAVNQDGKTNGITAPSPESQMAVELEAYAKAGIDPATLSYVEAHGTGTPLGDPIEIEGLTRAFRHSTEQRGFCAIGSVKTNIGHAAHAAGIAGLLKVLLSFRHGELYPSLNFTAANPHLHLGETPFVVNTALREWPRGATPRRAAVSSFGFSGTNAHLVLEEPPTLAPPEVPARPVQLIAVSARTETALRQRLRDLAGWLAEHDAPLADLAFTLNVGRSHMEKRWAALDADARDLAELLSSAEEGWDRRDPAVLAIGRTAQALADRDPALRDRLFAGGGAYLAGQRVDFAALSESGRRLSLPAYPFEEQRYWLTPEAPKTQPSRAITYLAPRWRPEALPYAELPPGPVLIIDRIGGRGAAVAEALRAQGREARLLLLGPGSLAVADLADSKVFYGTAGVSPATAAGTAAVPIAPAAVFHLADLDDAAVEPAAPGISESLFHLVRGLTSLGLGPQRLVYFHRGLPQQEAAAGFCRSLGFIGSPLRIRLARLDDSGISPQAIAQIGLGEAALSEPGEVSYAPAGRTARRIELLELREPARHIAPHAGGVYVITGGAGVLGRRLAQHLAQAPGVRIALIGRKPAQDIDPRILNELRAHGAEAEYRSCDVTDPAALKAVIGEVRSRFGPIAGAIHAAGVPGTAIVTEKDWAEFARVLAPKTAGLVALDLALAEDPLDFFAVFSSLAAELGDFGQCDYAVGNAFANRFAAWRENQRRAGRRQGKTLALAWPLWREGRQVLSPEGERLYLQTAGTPFLETADALRAFDLALAAEAAEVIVVPTDSRRALALFETAPAVAPSGPALAAAPAAEPAIDATGLIPKIETHLRGLISELLKLDPGRLDRTTGFADFGFDSIALKDFAAILGDAYAVEISPAVFFAHGSIAGLAAHLASVHPHAMAPRHAEPATPVRAAPARPAATPQPHVTADETANHRAIAIVGMSGVFPGSPDLAAFWRHLEAGDDLISEVPAERWDGQASFGPREAGHTVSKWGGFIADIDKFDHAFFAMSPREARLMDPQQRLAIEAVWKGFEDGGLRMADYAGRRVGVFFGQQVNEYAGLMRAREHAAAQIALGNIPAILPNRISYLFDFRGPSEAIDTACSSALVAVHRAVRALRAGDCELAVAGGVSAMLSAESFVTTTQFGVLSPDGRCRSFDARANGYVKGEGVGVVLLKPLARAVADGDVIHAVIRGSAENHGGRAQSMTAPNPVAQAELIGLALADAGVGAETIGYVEAHGTGTELGDPIEVEALKAAFAAHTRNAACRPGSCGLGTVKTNIGHLEPAAGIAGLIKTVLALQHRTLPATLHFETLNPYIALDGSPFYIVERPREWPALSGPDGAPLPRRAGVSSFGFGGTNAHVVVEEYAAPAPSPTAPPQLIVLSARDEPRLAEYANALADYVEANPALSTADIAYTLQCGRQAMAVRIAFVCGPDEPLAPRLRAAQAALLGEAPDPAVHIGIGNAAAGLLGDDADSRAFIASLLANGRLDQIARFWVEGATIDWTAVDRFALERGEPPRRISLPSCPFARTRCWFDDGPVPVASAEIREMPAAPLSLAPLMPGGEIRDIVAGLVAEALYIAPEALDPEAGFGDLGLDSILAVELAKAINDRLDASLQATRIYDHANVNALSAYLAGQLGAAPATLPMPAPAVPSPQPPTAPIAVASPSLEAVRSEVRRLVAAALYMDPAQIDDTAGLMDLGLDSIIAVELTKSLNDALGTDLSATRLYDYATVTDLAAHLHEWLAARAHTDLGQPSIAGGDDRALPWLKEQIAAALGVASAAVSQTAPLDSFAIEPAAAAAIIEQIGREFGVALEEQQIGRCADLRALAALMTGLQPTPSPAPANPAAPAVSAAPPLETPPLKTLRSLLAELLLIPAGEVDPTAAFADVGLDIVSATEFAARIAGDLGIPLQGREVFDYENLAALADALSAHRSASSVEPAKPVALPAPDVKAEDIAIVGLACRFPQAPDAAAFWRNLVEGRDAIGHFPAERCPGFEAGAGLATEAQRQAAGWGGYLDDIDKFDPLFFSLSPKEAELMDPQQRLFLEEAWHAFEDAGYTREMLAGSATGVFVGVGQGDYAQLLPRDGRNLNGQLLLGNTCSILTARIAYFLNLKGPSIALDTACSSSLVAIHLACKSLRDGETALALAGGINLMVTPQMSAMTAASGMLAPDGRCKTFDDSADGFVPGEGIGLLVLKRLADAVADGDRIYAVIKGSGINQDGKTSSITAPSAASQTSLETAVYDRFAIPVERIGYVEAHGTGTKLGDPIEIAALTDAFRKYTDTRQSCAIGSVKTNIGHTLAAAGVASVIKTALALRERQIPPSLHFAEPNRHIRFEDTPFYVNDRLSPWPAPDQGPRLAAVSSFGFSGTNAHLVMAEAPPAPAKEAGAFGPQLICLSARNAGALERRVRDLLAWLERDAAEASLADIAYTLGVRRSHFERRFAFVAASVGELRDQLGRWLNGEAPPARADPALAQAAADFVGGKDIDLAALCPNGRLLSLPGYPFEQLRCWIDSEAAIPAILAAVRARIERRLNPADPLLADHRVQDQRLFPAVGSLALMRDAAGDRALRDIAWLQPLEVAAATDIVIVQRSEAVAIEDREGTCFARARLGDGAPMRPAREDVAALRARCPTPVAPAAIQAFFARRGIAYGPSFQRLESVWCGDGEVVAEIRGGDEPQVLDAALQAAAALSLVRPETENAGAVLLPSSAAQLRVYRELPARVIGHLRVDKAAAAENAFGCDVTLLDMAGEVLLELRGFLARPLQVAEPVSAAATPLMYLRPVWQAEPAAATTERPSVLILHSAETRRWAEQAAAVAPGARFSLAELKSPDQTDFPDLLARHSNLNEVWFCCWRASAEPLTPVVLDGAEAGGVAALLGLAKALADKPAPGIRLKIVTRALYKLPGDGQPDPAFAALPGFAKTLAREHPRLGCTLIDLPAQADEDAGMFRRHLAMLRGEPGAANADIAYRDGRRYLRRLGRIEIDAGPLPLRSGGVYAIIGGAGGIGVETSKWLARVIGARVAWIGRRPLEPAIRADLAAVGAAGGEARYIQADATDPAALAEALATVRRDCGAIHGVFHMAIVLRDRLVATMTAGDLAATLAPKARGALALEAVLAGHDLDFLALFSSSNAYTCNPGQANYAAGCTFLDAWAEAFAERAGYPIKVINWGFWGEVGIVATDTYRARAAREGVAPIATAEGMAALGNLLAAPVSPIVVLKFDLARTRETRAQLPSIARCADERAAGDPAAATAAARQHLAAAPIDTAAANAAMAEIVQYGRRRLYVELATLGAFEPGATTVDALAQRCGVVPAYRGLFRACLDIAARGGLLLVEGERVLFDRRLPAPAGADRATPLRQDLRAAAPLALLDACLDGLRDVLTGHRDHTAVMFPGGSMALVEAVYADNPAADLYNEAIARGVAAFAESARAQTGLLRILEIGAGTGGTTRAVLRALAACGGEIVYDYTDISSGFLRHGEANFASFGRVDFRLLDIENEPVAQGFAPGTYDIVIAANVLHATARLATAVQHAKALLKAGGLLLLNEACAASDFATLTFGLTPGWWRFSDPEWREPHAPLANTRSWQALLGMSGFDAVEALTFGNGGQAIIAAVSDGWIETRDDDAGSPKPETARPQQPVRPQPERATDTLTYLRSLFGQVLKLDPAQFDPAEGYDRYGVDSLVSMELLNRLEADFGPLPKTLLFESITLDRLAAALEPLAPQRPAPAGETAPSPAPAIRGPTPASGTAVIGIAGRYPMAEDLDALWQNLAAGRECLTEVPPERWNARDFHDPSGVDPRKSVSCRGGFLADVDKFDPLFFQISPQEAAALDPQERLFLQTAWETLEDAGYTRARLREATGGKVGVFVGASNADYLRIGSEDWAQGGPGLASTAFWSIANRVSYFFDFRGPSLALDTACSSSLTALHLACVALRSGECNAALAGGVNLNLHPRAQVGLSRVGMLSRSGRARAFSAEADGMVQGEGVGAVLLKRLDDALRDGDRIHGVVRATAINASGRTAGYLMPNPEGQAALILDCLDRAGVRPDSIGYVEAQAVGSPIGDPVEIAGLVKAFGMTAGAEPCAIGSLKPNIGHLEAASGIAQLTKVLLQLRHRSLAPSINADPPNPNIDFAGPPFRVQQTAAPWPTRRDPDTGEALPRRAAISSFGAGGANAHAIVEEYAAPAAQASAQPGQPYVFPLSARDPDRLRAVARRLRDHLGGPGREQAFADIAWTLQIGREAMDHRLAIVSRDSNELRAALDRYLADEAGGWVTGVRTPNGAGHDRPFDATSTADNLAAHWAAGRSVAWAEYWPGPPASLVGLPSHPFDRRRCWIETRPPAPSVPALTGSTTRRAILVTGPGDVADLHVAELPLLPPGPGEVQIAVEACALNFADLLCLRGLYPNQPPYPFTPGFEIAGRIVAVAADVAEFALGDEVIALTAGGGGHADTVNVPAVLAVAKPAEIGFAEACAYPIGFLTARYALERAGLAAGERILIQGAAGATGLFAVQLALERGAEIIGTSGTADKLDPLRALGVAHAIDHRQEDFAARVRSITGGTGVDVVLNTLAGDAIQKGIDLLAPGGRYVEIALTGLKTTGGLDLSRFTENQSFISVNLGHLLARPQASRAAMAEMAASLAAGRIRPMVGASFPFAEIGAAYACLAERRNFGKVVVTVGEGAPAMAGDIKPAPVATPPQSAETIRPALARILCNTLKVTQAELEAAADFPSCGLNSILGVAIMREVQTALGIAAPVIALWEYPTLDRLAAHLAALSGSATKPVHGPALRLAAAARIGGKHDPIVAIQTGGSRPPSYWVHGAPGEISWVVKLAQALGPDYPVYGIEARGLDGQEPPLTSVPGMAKHYAAALLRRDPEGPYWLGGYSGGGAIAFELARQLVAQGKRVSRLVLLDANTPGSRSLLGMHEAYDEGFIDLLAGNWLGELWGAAVPLDGGALAGLSAQERLDAILAHLSRHAPPNVGEAELRRHLTALRRIGEVTGKALGKYRAQPLAGDTEVVLVRCRQGMSGADNRYRLPAFLADGDYRAGWDALCPTPIKQVEIDCDHFTLMTEPHCSAVAAALRALDEPRAAGVGGAAPNGGNGHHMPGWDSIFAALVEEVRNVLPALPAEIITPDRSLTELGANSIDRVEVATSAMERLDVAIAPEVLAKVRNLRDLADALYARVAATRNGHG